MGDEDPSHNRHSTPIDWRAAPNLSSLSGADGHLLLSSKKNTSWLGKQRMARIAPFPLAVARAGVKAHAAVDYDDQSAVFSGPCCAGLYVCGRGCALQSRRGVPWP